MNSTHSVYVAQPPNRQGLLLTLPCAAETAEQCAMAAAEKYDLPHSAQDLQSWERRRKEFMGSAVAGSETLWWEYTTDDGQYTIVETEVAGSDE